MRMGVTDKYWDRTKIYPNKFWADFNLTPDGKKALKLQNGGDVIQWRPRAKPIQIFGDRGDGGCQSLEGARRKGSAGRCGRQRRFVH